MCVFFFFFFFKFVQGLPMPSDSEPTGTLDFKKPT